MANKKVRVAIIGVGNCASSLVQGIQFYKDSADDALVPGIMHARLGAIISVISNSPWALT